MAVELTLVGGMLRPSPPVTLFTQRRVGRFNWFFSMDGRAERFLLVVAPDRADPAFAQPITVNVNWAAGLNRK